MPVYLLRLVFTNNPGPNHPMASDFFVIVLLVASLAAFVFLWMKLRDVMRNLEGGTKRLQEIERIVQGECLPAVTESSRRVTTVLDRLEADRASGEEELRRSRDGLAPILDELNKASTQLGEVRVELNRLIERAGVKVAEEGAKTGDGAWMRELVRVHLLGMGVGAISVDGVVAKPDGSHVVRARGMRGAELWTGNVVVRGGKVESALPVAARMFP
jgi:hypothetical protein